ncbi:SET domain-containing protein [Gonapodya prolifera JEL478]|uniref:SET domain-containing protein n=1 Tax=Gonapodya prolifera (strain JEL478) TaxID=1344416 RepID=A0A139AEP5_GONPJ|nr:SET domain-containing protein [Gonapodya prolifera JEL478]|eukprot:KXS15247.1 SET domain-containing protein [Gonapodya prolifera JEL478]
MRHRCIQPRERFSFFNHSCDSTLLVQTVFYDTENKDIQRLAAFASKDIRKGEELTFDYDGARAQYGVDMEDEDSDDASMGSSAGSSKTRKRRPLPFTSKRGRKNSRKSGSSAAGGGNGESKTPRKNSDNGRRSGCLCGSVNCRRQVWF